MKDGLFDNQVEPVLRETNRSAVLIIPRELYTNWANCVMEDGTKISEPELFLIPFMEDDEAAELFVKSFYDLFFQYELKKWNVSEAFWPVNRTWEMFLAWFEVKFSSRVKDSMITPVIRESEAFLVFDWDDFDENSEFDLESSDLIFMNDMIGFSSSRHFFQKPGLCLTCRKDYDEEEEVICELVRCDQSLDSEFRCDGYEPVN